MLLSIPKWNLDEIKINKDFYVILVIEKFELLIMSIFIYCINLISINDLPFLLGAISFSTPILKVHHFQVLHGHNLNHITV